MSNYQKSWLAFSIIGLLLLIIGLAQSWSVALGIFNMCLISSIVALGINIQWGYAGIANVGIMGFAALGGISAVLVSQQPVSAAWDAGWGRLLIAVLVFAITVSLAIFCYRKMAACRHRTIALSATIILGLFATRNFLDPAVASIEATEPAKTGYLGGMGLPIMFSLVLGGFVAAAVAWLIGNEARGLRSHYSTLP